MKRLSFIVILSILLNGCGGGSSDNNENNGKSGEKKINISFNGSSFVSKDSRQKISKAFNDTKVDNSLLKEYLKENSRGSLINRYTPTQFILDIDVIALSNKDFSSVLPSSGMVTHLGGKSARNFFFNDKTTNELISFSGIPQHYNIKHADKIIRDISVKQSSFESFWIEFLPECGSTSNDNYYVNSVVVLDLGEKYKGVTLANELNIDVIQKSDTEHIFSFATLQPFKSDFFGSIVFSNDVTKPYFIDSTDPNSMADGILLPQPKLDFTNFENPTVNLEWNIDNVVEIYDNNTNDKNDDIVTFNLNNPFPIRMKVVEEPARGESLYVNLTNPTIDNANKLEIIKDKVKTVIIDDDGLNGVGTVRFASNSYNTNEADGGTYVQVIREAGKRGKISIAYDVVDVNQSATIYDDYFASLEIRENNETNQTYTVLVQFPQLAHGILTWEDGDMSPKQIYIPLHDDNISESMEYFDIELNSYTNTNAIIDGWAKTRVNIYDNNNTNLSSGLLFASNYFYGLESDDNIDVKLVRIGNPNGSISVDVQTENALATIDVDFTADSTNLTWDDKNMTSQTYQITPIDDTTPEPFTNNTNDKTPPSEVYMLAARGTSGVTVVQWINPSDEDFDYVVVTRKKNSRPTSKGDGSVVYEGYKPYYQDNRDFTSGVNYYYLIQAVDKSGNISSGKVVNKVQH